MKLITNWIWVYFKSFIYLYKLNRNSKFKRILNADTHNIRITNADGPEQNSLVKKFLPLKGRWIQKRQFLKTEGFSSRSMVYCSTMG